MTDDEVLSRLPLEDLHQVAGARFGGFAGWSMPITYPLGVMKEHLHVREKAGLFDISHMRLFAVSGPDAAALVARACPLDPLAMAFTESRYTFFLDEEAGIIDDLIVTRLGESRFMIVANAGNAASDAEHLAAISVDFDVEIAPLDRVFLALQGPEAAAIIERAGIAISGLTFMHGVEPRPGWFLTRSGYTGEDGFEIGLPEADARALVPKLLEGGIAAWIGLAARDSLRLEAGLCLHGLDISTETTPVEAGLMWAIAKPVRQAGGFIGADGLRAAIEAGATRKRVGLKPEGRQPVRSGAALTDASGQPAGHVTSGGFGPSAGYPVAMGYVLAEHAMTGSKLFADIRGTRVPVAVHPLPFTPHRYFRG